MAKQCYVGIEDRVQRVKKGYIGIGGVARRIRKCYVGVEGVARPCWPVGDLVYYGKAPDLAYKPGNAAAYKGRMWMGVTTIGNYALFAGGGTKANLNSEWSQGSGYNSVHAYNHHLVKTNATALSDSNWVVAPAAVSIGNYALIAGGSQNLTKVDTYTADLVKGTAPELSETKINAAATKVGNYALIAGGQENESKYISSSTTVYDYYGQAKVDTYTADLVKGTAPALSAGRFGLAAATVGNYALIAGGMTFTRSGYVKTAYDKVDTYTADLVKGTAPELSVARSFLGAATVGGHALFAGGGDASNTGTTAIDAYSKDLVKTTMQLGTATANGVFGASSAGKDYALIGLYNTVEAFNSDLTKVAVFDNKDSYAKYGAGGTPVGDYILIGGGYGEHGRYVYVYTC